MVHTDILPPSAGVCKRYRDKIICLFGGIIAPEAMLAIAFGDWLAARKPLPDGMGKVHAFFANMGGIVIRYSETTLGNAPNLDDSTYFLDCNAIRALFRRGIAIEAISETQIKDKS